MYWAVSISGRAVQADNDYFIYYWEYFQDCNFVIFGRIVEVKISAGMLVKVAIAKFSL